MAAPLLENRFLREYGHVSLEFVRTGNPELAVFYGWVSKWDVPFIGMRDYLCVVVKETAEEKERTLKLFEGAHLLRSSYSGNIKLQLAWLIQSHANVKVFRGIRKGCCCPSKMSQIKQLLAQGSDFDCADGFSLLE